MTTIHEFGGLRYVEDKVPRPGGGIDDWWTNNRAVFGARAWYGHKQYADDIPIRPVLPPTRQELKVGDRLKWKYDALMQARISGEGDYKVIDVFGHVVRMESVGDCWFIPRETIDAAVAAGNLEVERDTR